MWYSSCRCLHEAYSSWNIRLGPKCGGLALGSEDNGGGTSKFEGWQERVVLGLEVVAEGNIIGDAEEVNGVLEDEGRGPSSAMKRGLNKK